MSITVPIPKFSVCATMDGRWSFVVTNETWQTLYYRRRSFATKETATEMARNCRTAFRSIAKRIEDGSIRQHVILTQNELFEGKFRNVVKGIDDDQVRLEF